MDYSYDTSPNATSYTQNVARAITGACDITFIEMYSYNSGGAAVNSRDLDATGRGSERPEGEEWVASVVRTLGWGNAPDAGWVLLRTRAALGLGVTAALPVCCA